MPRPASTGLSAAIVPPCAATMPLAMASPRPVPSPPSPDTSADGARANLSKMRGSHSRAMPGPVSTTSMRSTPSASASAARRMRASGPEYFTALPRILPIAWSSSVWSANRKGRPGGVVTVISCAAP